jgi:hypothetical protein
LFDQRGDRAAAGSALISVASDGGAGQACDRCGLGYWRVVSALITHTMSGRGFTAQAARLTRAWSEEQWTEGVVALRVKGLVDEAGGLTEQGASLRQRVEVATDRLSLPAWAGLGEEKAERLTDLGRKLRATILAAGAFPASTFGKA